MIRNFRAWRRLFFGLKRRIAAPKGYVKGWGWCWLDERHVTMREMTRKIRRILIRAFHRVNPASRRKVVQWETVEGLDFLRRIGIREGFLVIDFGCGPGRFCIPAAQVVGESGRVYAVDKNPSVLKQVRCKAEARGLRNLRAVPGLAELNPWPESRGCDVALLYDMLHFLDPPGRKKVYAALRDVLAENGRISVHLQHVKGREPAEFFKALTAEDVIREIEAAGYELLRRVPVRIWHAHGTVDSEICDFSRKR
ncbi:MAG: class I SAM-dependent methyltransferase [Planctomycetota bacterium]